MFKAIMITDSKTTLYHDDIYDTLPFTSMSDWNTKYLSKISLYQETPDFILKVFKDFLIKSHNSLLRLSVFQKD